MIVSVIWCLVGWMKLARWVWKRIRNRPLQVRHVFGHELRSCRRQSIRRILTEARWARVAEILVSCWRLIVWDWI